MINWIPYSGFDPAVSSPASLQIIQRNASGQWVNRAVVGTETNTTPVAGANDTVLGASNTYYTIVTMPTTAPAYIITGLEVLNGTVVNGSFVCNVNTIDANPPSVAKTTLLALSAWTAQSGASAVQRVSQLTQYGLLLSGQTVALGVASSSATGRYGTTTVGSVNNFRAIAAAASQGTGSTTAWQAGTEEPYIKMYYKPFMGV